MSRYFPGQENTPQEQLERPGWAKGVAMTADARETAPRSTRDRKWLKAKFQGATPRVFERLLELLEDEDGRTAMMAARMLAEYGWGKPEQPAGEGDGDPRKRLTDPEALRGRLVAVFAEVGPGKGAGGAGEVIDALPALPPERG